MQSMRPFLACAAVLVILSGCTSAPRVSVSDDGRHLTRGGQPWRPVGFNYDHDRDGRLIEDYWLTEWDTVASDFREMTELGGNVVRVHLQLSKFMASPTEANPRQLAQLDRLLSLADEIGITIDLTGLGLYHKQDIPAWLLALDEQAHWQTQANFWRAVARIGVKHECIAWYDLINEPVIPGNKETDWLVGNGLGGKFFVQRIVLDPAGRDRFEIARQWTHLMRSAIRDVDQRHLITVGMFPWVAAGFDPQKMRDELDFVCVHIYPNGKNPQQTEKELADFRVGKALVIEEFAPLNCTLEQAIKFMDDHATDVDGWVSFYWGKTVAEMTPPGNFVDAIMVKWIPAFMQKAQARGASPAAK
jgi:hypothetical protein